jgi:hypothetical protein
MQVAGTLTVLVAGMTKAREERAPWTTLMLPV